jgi:hypothetical protein
MKVGSGDLQFELVPNWEQLPTGYSHPDVAAVCTDSADNVYLYCRGEHPVMIYDVDGNFVDSWGEGQFSYRTHGMFMNQNQHIFLVDDDGNSVTEHAIDGTKLATIGPAHIKTDTGVTTEGGVGVVLRAAGPYNRPTNAAVAPSGDIYVSDGYANSRVHSFSAGGELLQSWGTPGDGPGEFHLPHGIWVHPNGRVFVADRENDRIQIFSPTGELLKIMTNVRRPGDLFIDADNVLYVGEMSWEKGETSLAGKVWPEDHNSTMTIRDIDGNVLSSWGNADVCGPGGFSSPHGLWVDAKGSIYVGEVTHTALTRYNRWHEGCHSIVKYARV